MKPLEAALSLALDALLDRQADASSPLTNDVN
jgi:hypothetical protein